MENYKATLTTKGQVTIPIRVRKYLELDTGSEIKMTITNDGIVTVEKDIKNDIIGMIDSNKLFRDIHNIINDRRVNNVNTILTVDLIREHQGNYYNANTNAQNSWNSLFGKFLKNNCTALQIRETRKDVETKDDNGNRTQCSEWEIL